MEDLVSARALHHHLKLRSRAHHYRFEVAFSSLDWVPNFEKNRWFLVLRVKVPENNGLNKLLHVSNTVVQEYGQAPLYVEASPRTAPKHKRPRFDTQRK